MQKESPELKRIEAIVADYFQQSGQNQTVDINTSRQCGQILLQHCNNTGEQAAFILIVVKGYEQAHYLTGVEGGLHFWKQISSGLSSLLSDDTRLAMLPFGYAIHLWGDDVLKKTQRLIDSATALLHHPVLLPDIH